MDGDRKGLVIAGAGLAVAAVAAVAVTSWAGTDAGVGSSREAVAQCEGFADRRLKTPATAEYDLEASESDGSWTVTGVVDSQNGFGALVRSDVMCVLHFEGDRAHLDDISVG